MTHSAYIPDSCPDDASAPWNRPDAPYQPAVTCHGCKAIFDCADPLYDEVLAVDTCSPECAVVHRLRELYGLSAKNPKLDVYRDNLKVAINTLLWARDQGIEFARYPLTPDKGSL